MIHDLPLEARTHRPVAADYVRHTGDPVTIRSALRNGESPRTAVAVAVMLAVLMVIGIVL